MRRLFLFFILLWALVGTAEAAEVEVLTPFLRPGQTLIVRFEAAPESVRFDGAPRAAFPYQSGWRVVLPLLLSEKTGAHTLTAQFKDGTVTKFITVLPRLPRIVLLPVPPKLKQTPAQLVQNLAMTNAVMKRSVEAVTASTRFKVPFGLPLRDNRKISSPFGEVRKTGDESITHLGMDFEASRGAAVGAVNAGKVVGASEDPIYGKNVIVDHGRGIYSLYLHLEAIRVKSGEAVKKGALVGTVGDSGLASAPHLHLSIKINGQSVDPIQFVSAFK